MTDAQLLYFELESHISVLEDRLISGFLKTSTAQPQDYDLPVRAYCVLSHAALEEYLEKIALYVMHESINRFLVHQKYGDTLLTLTTYLGLTLKVDREEGSQEKKAYDYLRPILDDARMKFSNSVHQNQGISIRHVRNLLIPVAVDIKQDVSLKNSLMQLSKQRGAFAHKGVATRILAPEDAKSFVSDCLQLCYDIKEKVDLKFE